MLTEITFVRNGKKRFLLLLSAAFFLLLSAAFLDSPLFAEQYQVMSEGLLQKFSIFTNQLVSCGFQIKYALELLKNVFGFELFNADSFSKCIGCTLALKG